MAAEPNPHTQPQTRPCAYRLEGEELILEGTGIPPAWNNILATEKAFSLINAHGQGLAVDRECGILHYGAGKRHFYVHDPATGEGFSPTFAPMGAPLSRYTVRMHPAYNRYAAESALGLRSEAEVAVDPETGGESWSFTVGNAGPRERVIHFTAVFFFGHIRGLGQHAWWDAGLRALVRQVVPFFLGREAAEDKDEKNWQYLLCDREPASHCASLAALYPHEEMAAAPPWLKGGDLGNRGAFQEQTCAAVTFKLTLAPGASATLRLMAGAARGPEEIRAKAGAFDHGRVLEASLAHWRGWDAGLRAELPHAEMQAFVNTWAKHQTRMNCVTGRWSLAPATRNWIIDWEAAAYLRPAEAVEALKAALSSQRGNGYVPQGFALARTGRLVDMHNMDFRDAAGWVPFLAQVLLEVTGDAGFLRDRVPYADGGDGTVLEHLLACARFLRGSRGARGLVLIGEGDWNDLLNNMGKAGKGESVMLTSTYLFALRNLVDICRWAGEEARVPELEAWFAETAQALNANAWDGHWYVRGYTDAGEPVGSDKCDEGKIYLTAQAWSLMARAVPAERVPVVVESVKRELGTPFGALLLAPAYTRTRRDIGRITICLPGLKENGSSYLAGSLFHAFGLYRNGLAEEAYALLRQVLPGNPDNPPERSGQNPAYIPNCYNGPAAGPAFAGKGSNHNWTGTAPWFLWLVLRETLGVKGTPAGLKLEPAFPAAWDRAALDLPFRGATVKIRYRRGTQPGLYREGRRLPGDELKVEAGRTYEVERVI